MFDIAITIFASVFIAGGIILTLVPFVPALLLMLLVASGYALYGDFARVTLSELGVLAAIFLISVFIDFFAGLAGAKYGGAGWRSMLWGVALSIVGFFVFPPFGALIGFFLGIFGKEFYEKRNERLALRAALGGIAGALTGAFINVLLALTFFGLFIFFILN